MTKKQLKSLKNLCKYEFEEKSYPGKPNHFDEPDSLRWKVMQTLAMKIRFEKFLNITQQE